MHNNTDQQPSYLDDALAAFADHALNDGVIEVADEPGQEDLRDLQRVVIGLQQSLRPEPVPQEMSARILGRLQQEWQQFTPAADSAVQHQRQDLGGAARRSAWQSSRQMQRRLSLAVGGLAVALVIYLLVTGLVPAAGMTGAAQQAPAVPVLIVVAAALAVLVIAWVRRR